MKAYLNELKKYIKDDPIIDNLYQFLNLNILKDFTIFEIENFLNSLNEYLKKIKNIDQISIKRRNKILNVLNEIIIFYNEILMEKICKEL